ncbi:MAG: hypothetical protein GY847_13910 [Proteobacteria bacterium]|nr:hypothetical protein [Pseudomonadota bacterium]
MFLHRYLVGFVFLLGAAISLASFNAHAGGGLLPDLGAVALGRGGAFVARADNLSAFYYNPAGLSKLKGYNIILGSNLINANIDYLRQGGNSEIPDGEPGSQWISIDENHPEILVGNPERDHSNVVINEEGEVITDSFRVISNQTPIAPSAVLIAGSYGDAFGLEGLSIAIGLNAPSGSPSSNYPSEGPQRYVTVKSGGITACPGVGVSYAFNRYFQFGAVFSSGVAMFTSNQKTRMAADMNESIDFNEDVIGDADFAIDVKDWFMPTGVVGILSNPVDWLEIGVAVRAPMYVKAKGKITFTPSKLDFPEAAIVEGHDKAILKTHFPLIVSGGIRFIHRIFDIEADYVWENWSSVDGVDIDLDLQVNLDPDNPVPPTDVSSSHLPKNFRSTYSARVGSDILVWPEHITFRLGGFYQSSAYPKNNNTFSLLFPHARQFGAGTGLSWHTFEFLSINIGYLHIFQPRIEVTEGILQQSVGSLIDLSEAQDGSDMVQNGNIINNGLYDVSMNLFSASIEGHF